MANQPTCAALLAGLMLSVTPAAYGQATTPTTEKFFLNINGGGQFATRSLSTSSEQPIYGEVARTSATQDVKRGVVIDVGVGARVWGDVFVGVIGTRFHEVEEARWTASVPNPVFFDRPATSTGTVPGLERDEYGITPHIGLAQPLTDRVDIVVSAGLSLMYLKQDRLAASQVTPGTQTITFAVVNEKVSGVGPYGAVEVVYNVASKLGIGGFVRFSGAKVELSSAPDHNLGGLMSGAGIRLRF